MRHQARNIVRALMYVSAVITLAACSNQGNQVEALAIESFTATPSEIQRGHRAVLRWKTQRATQLIINPGSRVVTGLTELAVSPTSSTIYTLTASNGSNVETRTVSVTVVIPPIAPDPSDPQDPSIVSLTIDQGNQELEQGDRILLSATVVAQGDASTGVTWTSSDPSTASVSEDGEVIGLGLGVATVTATSVFDAGFSDDVTIVVIPAPTAVGGIISADTTWSLEHSPYLITSEVQIDHNATLTIEPGVEVRGGAIRVWGALHAAGVSGAPVVLRDVTVSGGSPDESRPYFMLLDHTEFFDVDFLPPTGDAAYGSFTVQNSTIHSGFGGVHIWYPTSPATFYNNRFLAPAHINAGHRASGVVSFVGNTFVAGGLLENWAAYDAPMIVQGNNFLDTSFRVALRPGYSSSDIDARGNYWGTTDESVIESMISDRNDSLDYPSYIEFRPYLLEPGGELLPVQEFRVDLRFGPQVTGPQSDVLRAAAARWEQVIVGALDSVPIDKPANFCGQGEPALHEVVDNVVIYIDISPIDGVGGTLGMAGPCLVRTANQLPIYGLMVLDSADVALMLSNGTLESVVVHEMGHVLGVGTIWPNLGLLNYNSSECLSATSVTFNGPRATAEWQALGGIGGLPVESNYGPGTKCGHWSEAVFDTELMTGFAEAPGVLMPLSSVTVASLADLGYEVDMNAADPYNLPVCSPACLQALAQVETPHTELLMPEYEVLPSGAVRPLGTLAD